MSAREVTEDERTRLYRTSEAEDGEAPFTLAEFIEGNAGDEYVIEEVLPEVRALDAGESITLNHGAGGITTITRVS